MTRLGDEPIASRLQPLQAQVRIPHLISSKLASNPDESWNIEVSGGRGNEIVVELFAIVMKL